MLRLRSKMALAVTAMIDVAMNHPHGPVALSKIAERHTISITSLEEIFSKLLGHQLVKSTRGPGGGYSLRVKADDITLADIALAVDDAMHQDASWICGSMRSELWAQFNQQVLQQLRSIRLSHLVREQHMGSGRGSRPSVRAQQKTRKALGFAGLDVVPRQSSNSGR